MNETLEYLEKHKSDMLRTLEELVTFESPSTDKPNLDKLSFLLKKHFNSMGARVVLIENPLHGNLVDVTFDNSSQKVERPALILCHYDTVWPKGTLKNRPFVIEGNRAFGPGIFDMKASIVIVEYALRSIINFDMQLARPVKILITSDEEILSPSSRPTIEKYALQSEYVLAMEPPLPNGELKTARKGTWQFKLIVEGKAAHAGIEPEKGASAIHEMARQITFLNELSDMALGTTVNVGVIKGGVRPNVVAPSAEAEVDVRSWELRETNRLQRAIRDIEPFTSGVSIKINEGFYSPPMERNLELFSLAKKIGNEIGLDIQEGSVGGGSDANYTAALGVPTLDGLGALGNGAHSDSEYINIDSLPIRANYLISLLKELKRSIK